MVKSDVAPWNSMLMGYATDGYGLKALELINEMRHSGVKLDYITFTGVLSGCDHCGFLEEGWKWFNVMIREDHIDPGIQHYSCMVDLFARAVYLGEALNLIKHMSFEADGSMWSMLLRGCVAPSEKDLGDKVVKRNIEMDPENSAAYVQQSGLLATAGDWGRSAFVRKTMRSNAVHNNPGYAGLNVRKDIQMVVCKTAICTQEKLFLPSGLFGTTILALATREEGLKIFRK